MYVPISIHIEHFLDTIGSMRGLPSMDSGFGHNFIKNSSFCLYMGIIALPIEIRT
jgi:hypothetical protein